MGGDSNGRAAHGRTLVLAPHVDDEVLGCHAFLSPGTRVCYFGLEDRPSVSAKQRLRELEEVADHRGFEWELFDFTVNDYRCPELITPIEKVVNACQPRVVLVPHPSYNQDHRTVFHAALTALRPHDLNWFAPVVLAYEQPHVQLWFGESQMEPNYFVPVDIEDKVKTYRMYASQVREHRSADLLVALAKLRGAQANLPYAEGFVCRRFVDGTPVHG